MRIGEIDKGIANIAFVLEVDRQIEEIISSFVFAVDSSEEHFLIVFVGYVFNHESRAQVLTTAHFVQVEFVFTHVFGGFSRTTTVSAPSASQ